MEVDPHGMGLAVLPEGRYRTACGKGYFECEEGEPEEIDVKFPALSFFKFESAASAFYWDRRDAAFKKIWLSD